MSSAASDLDDHELAALLPASPLSRRSPWATSYRAELAGHDVFVKRIPLTDAEAANPGSTRNHFGLPSFYQYGVGSAGFGAYRELAGHTRTTKWALDRALTAFPLLHHSRVLPRGPLAAAGPERRDEYLAKWNGSAEVARYLQARDAARHELWLILEYLPQTVGAWLPAHQSAVPSLLGQLCAAISFLRGNGVVHFDAHLSNALVSAEHVYLADFGLVLDEGFELDAGERAFLGRHSHYDYGEAIAGVGSVLVEAWRALPAGERDPFDRKYGIGPQVRTDVVLRRLLDRIDEVAGDGDLPVEPELAAFLRRYRDVIVLMSTFLTRQRLNPRKDTPYDDRQLARLLDAAGLPEPPQRS